MLLKYKAALITGAGSGIGKAAAVHCAKEGAKVAILSRTREELEEVAEEIKGNGSAALIITADTSKPDEMKGAFEKIETDFGSLDYLFANAGINGVWAPLEELEPEEWSRTININLNGTFHSLKYALPLLKKNGGSVVITSSVNGTRMFSNTGASAYACSKAAQVAFAKMSSLELAKYKIRVNVICPGAILSDIEENTKKRNLEKIKEPVIFPEGKIPLTDGKPGSPDQVADLVVFLFSDASSHITGSEIWIDGAQSLLQG